MALLAATPFAPDRFLIAGLCSGADAGFQMAQNDPRIVGLFMMEPYYFPNRFSRMFRTLRRLREYGLRRAVIRIAQKLGIAGAPHASNESSALPLPAPEETVRQAPSPARLSLIHI